MISHPHRCIFIHQRKCAGSAIKQAFGLKYHDEDRNYATDGVLSAEFHDRPPGYLVFAVVRNPWDRFVSGWRYCRGTRDRKLADVLADLPRDGHDYRHLTRPQYAILYDSMDRPVFDVLLRYESLQQDFDALSDRLHKPRTRLPVVNRKPHAHYSRYFDAQSLRLFERAFACDIERFAYQFEQPPRSWIERLADAMRARSASQPR